VIFVNGAHVPRCPAHSNSWNLNIICLHCVSVPTTCNGTSLSCKPSIRKNFKTSCFFLRISDFPSLLADNWPTFRRLLAAFSLLTSFLLYCLPPWFPKLHSVHVLWNKIVFRNFFSIRSEHALPESCPWYHIHYRINFSLDLASLRVEWFYI
jgi:hypothetical protein